LPFRKKRASALKGRRRGKGPSTYTRIAEIMSGRAIYQQGLATTCKDLLFKSEIETARGIWSDA
jgi:hypothetical protein